MKNNIKIRKMLPSIKMAELLMTVGSGLAMLFCNSCEIIDHSGEKGVTDSPKVELRMGEVAGILSEIPIALQQMQEVHDAVTSSSVNGYDDEYTMKDLFRSPGAGVGDDATKSDGGKSYEKPLKDMFAEYFATIQTKAGAGSPSPEEYLKALMDSDMQIYWPYYENWDSKALPVITFDPEDGSEKNIGYQISMADDGSRKVEEVIVDEEMAKSRPVWVINRNDDSGYTSIEMLRRRDPDWGSGGGEIIIGGKSFVDDSSVCLATGECSVVTNPATKYGNSAYSDNSENSTHLCEEGYSSTGSEPKNRVLKSLILKDFTMNRNFDPWFAGASEFFVKCGCVENFTASTEAELLLYNPDITDFMIVVKRSKVGKPCPFNALLVSKWTEQFDYCAFMITEDDGGTKKSWKCEAGVSIKSKKYGLEISLPYNSRDDIVWRGKLAGRYLEEYSGQKCNFGDVSLTFELAEKVYGLNL